MGTNILHTDVLGVEALPRKSDTHDRGIHAIIGLLLFRGLVFLDGQYVVSLLHECLQGLEIPLLSIGLLLRMLPIQYFPHLLFLHLLCPFLFPHNCFLLAQGLLHHLEHVPPDLDTCRLDLPQEIDRVNDYHLGRLSETPRCQGVPRWS